MLLVELGQLVEIVQVGTRAYSTGQSWPLAELVGRIHTSLNGIEFLPPCLEMEALRSVSKNPDSPEAGVARERERILTSVSIGKSGAQLAGGTIFAMPYLDASGPILAMYWNGSLNSSSVGRYVGASSRPNMRFGRGGISGLGTPGRLRSTVWRSSGGALRALRGMFCTAGGCTAVAADEEAIAMAPIRDFGAEGAGVGVEKAEA